MYESRGWCFFESTIASTGSRMLLTIHDGHLSLTSATPVPQTPDGFSEAIQQRTFTNGQDASIVANLYRKVFPGIAKRTRRLHALAWGDAEVRLLLAVLPALTGLDTMCIFNNSSGCSARVSPEAEAELSNVLKARGGKLLLSQRHPDFRARREAARRDCGQKHSVRERLEHLLANTGKDALSVSTK